MNVWTGTGRLTRTPEVKYAGSKNTCFANFGLAVRKKYHAEGEAEADFFEVRAMGKTAEFVEKYLNKGMKIEVHGRLEQNTWTTKEGEKRSNVRILAEEIEFGESKASAEANASASAPSAPTAQPEQPKKEESKADTSFMDIPTGDLEELPFS